MTIAGKVAADLIPDERRRVLVAALRRPMPEGFGWNFDTLFRSYGNDGNDLPEGCGSVGCALGLASLLWPEEAETLPYGGDSDVADFFGITSQDVDQVFYNGPIASGVRPYTSDNGHDITPQMVADALEAIG